MKVGVAGLRDNFEIGRILHLKIRNPRSQIGPWTSHFLGQGASPIKDFRFEINGVPTLLEQNELIAVVMIDFFTCNESKCLLDRNLFEERNAEDLQN